MGPLHEADFFAEAVINPSASIEKGKGYEAPDGSSRMPPFSDVMSVREAIDLVAFPIPATGTFKRAGTSKPLHRGH